MSWIFSQALVTAYANSPSSLELVEEFSAASCSDGEPSPPSSGESTPQAYCAPDKMTAFSRLSRFGMTFKPLTASHGADLLTWYLAASRAKTSALPEKALASPESDQACGPTWRGSLAKYDPVSLSWKTVQLCLLGDSELSSVIWPRSGMTAGGECWELPTLEPITSATGSGLWQTPVADDSVNRVAGKWNSRGEPKLSAQVLQWPTPLANSHTGAGHGPNKTGAPNLQTMVKAWPTPAARDYRSSNKLSYEDRGGGKKGEQLPNAVGGQLNPTWVEWLMGWPLGWTDLKPSVTDKCHFALQQHGDCLEGQ